MARHDGDELYVTDTGSRLTTPIGFRGGKPLLHPISPPPNPCSRLLSVATIAHRVSFRHRKCHAYGFYASLLTAVAQAHTAFSVTLGIGAPSRTDTRCRSLHKPNAQSGLLSNAYGSARAHSMLQSSCAPLPLSASPVLSLRSGVVGGVSLPEVLHYARRTQCLSPPNEHSLTSPNHEIEP